MRAALSLSLFLCAGSQNKVEPHRIIAIDVKRAYFYALAMRPLFVHIPKQDKEEGDEKIVAELNLSLYGTRDAAMNWAAVCTEFLISIGYVQGESWPCNFHHPSRGLATTVHGDDFTSTGSAKNLL